MSFNVTSDTFWSEPALDEELRRVFDLCNGCRRCLPLCPSFNTLFQRLDDERVDGEAEKLGEGDLQVVGEECYQCKLCYNHCPYTPPHRWAIDFPRLMLRQKVVRSKREGVSLQDRILGRTDLIGRLACMTAPLLNRLNRARWNRRLMEAVLGIHRDWPLPDYASEPFDRWFRREGARKVAAADSPQGKVVLFPTCSVNYNDVAVGQAAVQVLAKNQIEVAVEYPRCCGMPALDGGDLQAALEAARVNVRVLSERVMAGFDVVVPGPTCSYVLKQEYPALLEDEASREVSAHTFDLSEYLMRLHGEGRLNTEFTHSPGVVAYHLPCHLKAQNIGYKSRDLMQLTGARVDLIEKCSAVDGTWGMKAQYHELSLKWAKPLLNAVEAAKPDVVATDCPLSALRIFQGTGRRPVHPVQVLLQAYGL
ncbi:MAG: 4Fe-4S dicluster domain-containing protein [candidate division NC10 bacterium]|nr:4Fe-4S dicluster domain-containing protein [candidate division NC10 bacterium]